MTERFTTQCFTGADREDTISAAPSRSCAGIPLVAVEIQTPDGRQIVELTSEALREHIQNLVNCMYLARNKTENGADLDAVREEGRKAFLLGKASSEHRYRLNTAEHRAWRSAYRIEALKAAQLMEEKE